MLHALSADFFSTTRPRIHSVIIQHQHHRSLIWAVLLTASVLTSPAGRAETKTAAAAELTIEGDSAVFLQNENRIEYSGNVIAFMDGMRITGDKVAVQMNEDRIVRIVTLGGPANFWQNTPDGDEATTASATTIVFLPEDSALELTGSASLRQAGNTVNSASIRYDLALGKLTAYSDETTTDRVRMQLTVPAQTPTQGGNQP